jgi:aspartyl-tRNA(Asn)/glutamyl-tRNA(Gln) amidotransferase subunit A
MFLTNNMDIKNLTINKIQEAYKNKEYSCLELTKEYLKAIHADETNSFISVNDHVLDEAKQADQLLGTDQATPLTGVPIAVKDIILVKDQKSTGGSKILSNYVASYTATAVQRLKDAGMVILGKTNCDEFAMGSSNENSHFGPVLNPHDVSRVPGGSSGGSAAAIAANLTPIALGTDTGGSIRQPASFCGITGVKPSYGRVSRYGSMSMTSSLDQIGPMANSVKDTAYILQVMAGFDPKDATSLKTKSNDYLNILEQDPKKLIIGIPKEYFSDNIQVDTKQAIEQQIEKLKSQGFEIKEVSLSYTDYALAAYYLLMPAEVSSNLARYDGLLYGLEANKDLSLDEWYKTVRSTGFGAESKRRIMLGAYILSAGYYDAYYKKAQKIRTLIKADFAKVFKEVDILLTPATPSTAFKLGDKVNDPVQMYLSDVFTVSANVAGICGLVLPVARDANDLPIGMQLLADSQQEEKLFSLGNYIENLK